MTKTETEKARKIADRDMYYKKCLAGNPGNNRGGSTAYNRNRHAGLVQDMSYRIIFDSSQ